MKSSEIFKEGRVLGRMQCAPTTRHPVCADNRAGASYSYSGRPGNRAGGNRSAFTWRDILEGIEGSFCRKSIS